MEFIFISIVIGAHPIINTDFEPNTDDIFDSVFELLILFDFGLYFFDNFFDFIIIELISIFSDNIITGTL